MNSFIRFINEYLNTIVIIISLVSAISAPVLYFWRLWRWKKDKVRQLDDFYGNGNEAIRFLKSSYFIPIKYQATKPHDIYKDELNKSQTNVTTDNAERGPLVQKLLDDILHSNTKKRFMILGGSGMGKSTLSASLYVSILNHYKLRKCPFPFYVCSLFDSEIFVRLKQINNEIIQSKQNINEAVIILDGLDENSDAVKNYKDFLSNIESATKSFRVVVITSRTQLFPHGDHEPKTTKILFTAGNGTVIEYDKYYISPFNSEETKIYLKNKYKDDPIKYQSALRIIENTKDLVSRPMILSSIDGLLHLSDKQNLSLVEVYLCIVDYWRKRDSVVKDFDSYKYYSFSKKIALHLYNHYHNASGDKKELAISFEEFNLFLQENYGDENPYSFRVRSLLNRTSGGKVKFAHRSFFELFIAINAIEKPGLSIDLEDDDTSLAPSFFNDLYSHYRQKKELLYIVYSYSDNINIQESYRNKDFFNKFLIAKESISMSSNSGIDSLKLLWDFYEAAIRRLSNHMAYVDYWLNIFDLSVFYRKGDIHLDEIRNNPERLKLYYDDLENAPQKRELLIKSTDVYTRFSLALLYNVQNMFVENNAQFAEMLVSLEEEYNKAMSFIDDYFKQVDRLKNKYHHNVDEFEKPHSANQAFIFPDILELDPAILSSYISSKKECYIGRGFNDDRKVHDLIRKIKEKEISRIYIFIEGNDLDSYIHFIKSLSSFCVEENEAFILVLTIESVRVYYVVINKTKSLSEMDIRMCLLNMIKTKKQITMSK